MRVAVTSEDFATISGHAGRCRRFWVFEADGQGEPVEVARVEVPEALVFHHYQGGAHPLLETRPEAVITQSAGAGFVQRLTAHGIAVHVTAASDPLAAVRALASGEALPPGEAVHQCGCGA